MSTASRIVSPFAILSHQCRCLLASRHWGQGHAHAAMQAMLGHLGQACGVGLYMATVEAGNQRSIRLLERLGFHGASAQEAEGHELSATERLFLR